MRLMKNSSCMIQTGDLIANKNNFLADINIYFYCIGHFVYIYNFSFSVDLELAQTLLDLIEFLFVQVKFRTVFDREQFQ